MMMNKWWMINDEWSMMMDDMMIWMMNQWWMINVNVNKWMMNE